MLEDGIWTRRQGLCGGTITVLDAGETMYAVEEEEEDFKNLGNREEQDLLVSGVVLNLRVRIFNW